MIAAAWPTATGPAAGLPRRAEVHVWGAELDQRADVRARLGEALSADEAERAARFHFPRDRDHFVTARGWLRAVLGGYLATAPGLLRFRYGPRGKPALDGAAAGSGLRFNLSHSGGLALLAVACERELGVDVEARRPLADADEIAQRFFSPRESATFRALGADVRQRAFFECWTRKEAYIKATGDGLACDLADFDVTFAPGEPARLERVRFDPAETQRWWLCALDPAPGFAAALAVEGGAARVRCRHWIPPQSDRHASGPPTVKAADGKQGGPLWAGTR